MRGRWEGRAPGAKMATVTRERPAHDFERVFREHRPALWRTIYAFTGGRRDVTEEVVAEAFARALAHARHIREPLPWLYRTAFRLATAELGRDRRRGERDPDAVVEPGEVGEVMEALRALSPTQRAAVVLRYEAGFTVAEVAERLGMASPTVRVHLHRARKRLRRLLGSEEVDDA